MSLTTEDDEPMCFRFPALYYLFHCSQPSLVYINQPTMFAATNHYHIIISTNICVNKMTTKAAEENTEVCWRGIGLAEMCKGVHSMDLLLVASVYGSTVTHF
jgi:hypothetical protein